MSELENQANSQKGFAKLFEVLRDSLLGVIKPSYLEKTAIAQASAASIASTSALKTALKQNLANEISQATLSARETRQIHNIANIYALAAQELQMIDNISKAPVSPEWSARFFDYALDICEEDAQIIWGKLLAGEIANPGTFFKRTLSVLRNIEPFEAKWFADICQFVLEDYILPNYILTQDYFPTTQFQSLIDCGLINSIKCEFGFNAGTMEIHGKSQSLKLISPKTGTIPQMHLGHSYTLTDVGIQLCKITPPQNNPTCLLKLKENIKAKYNIESELV